MEFTELRHLPQLSRYVFSFTHLFNETAARAIYSLGLWLASDLFISPSDDSGLIIGRMSLKGNKL